MTCYTLLVASPVPDDLTVTAADCTVIYNDMAVPGGVTVSVEPGGTLLDGWQRIVTMFSPVGSGVIGTGVVRRL